MVAVTVNAMTQALRVVSVERGHDPAGAALIAFGGAGPLHACELAAQLGATQVLCLPASGVLSAVGLAAAERRRDASRSLLRPLAEVDGARSRRWPSSRPREDGEEVRARRRPALRRPVVRAADPVRRPRRARRRVPRRARAPLRPRRPGPRGRAGHAARRRRPARRRGPPDGRRRRRALAPDDPLGGRGRRRRGAERDRPAAGHRRSTGPAIVEFPETTCLVPPGWAGTADEHGILRLELAVNAAELQVAVGSLRGIAEEMGTALIHSALSPNIKERRDCSTALFDADGRLVIQAEHIPVHLGALPASVAAVRARDVAPGEVWVLNDPFLGGSHLPDITLVSPIHVDGELLGWAASRAHHADVGGMVPASMPADSTELHQEGLILPPARADRRADRPDRGELARRRRAARRPARAARRAPARRAPRGGAVRAPRGGLVARRLRRGVGLRRAAHPRRDRGDAGRALRGDRDGRGGRGRPRDPRGGRDRRRRGARRLRRHGAAARREPQLPARRHRVGVLLRAARGRRSRRARLRRRLRADRRRGAGGLAGQRAAAGRGGGGQRRDLQPDRRLPAARVRARRSTRPRRARAR